MADIMTAAKELADRHRVKTVVVASDSGGSARDALEVFGKEYALVAVGIPPELRRIGEFHKTVQELTAQGVKYLVSFPILGHPISPLDRKLHPGDTDPLRVIQRTLRIFGEGAKVCLEIAMIAADQDAISTDHDCVAVVRPPDVSNCPHTAMVVHPAKSGDIFEHTLRVKDLVLVPGPKDHWFTDEPLWKG